MISGGGEEDGCLGSNQLLLKSKKQWSDQWQDEAKSIREALVGMNRSGSQLWGALAGADKTFGEQFKQTFLGRTSCPLFPRHYGRRSRLCCHPGGRWTT